MELENQEKEKKESSEKQIEISEKAQIEINEEVNKNTEEIQKKFNVLNSEMHDGFESLDIKSIDTSLESRKICHIIDLSTLTYKIVGKLNFNVKEIINILFSSVNIYILNKSGSSYVKIEKCEDKKFIDTEGLIFVFPDDFKTDNKMHDYIFDKGVLNTLLINKHFMYLINKKYKKSKLLKLRKVFLEEFINDIYEKKFQVNSEISSIIKQIKERKMDIEKILINKSAHTPHEKILKNAYSNTIGLRNLTNTCYFNVTMQLLMNCEVFISVMIEHIKKYINPFNKMGTSGEMTLVLREFFMEYLFMTKNTEEISKVVGVISPDSLIDTFRKFNNYFDNSMEHDSTDALFLLLSQIEEDTMSLRSTNDKIYENLEELDLNSLRRDEKIISPISSLFYGFVEHKKECINCEETKTRKERFINFELRKTNEIKKYKTFKIFFKSKIYLMDFNTDEDIKEEIRRVFGKESILIKHFKFNGGSFLSKFYSEKEISILILDEFPNRNEKNKKILKGEDEIFRDLLNFPYFFLQISFKNFFYLSVEKNLILENIFYKKNVNLEEIKEYKLKEYIQKKLGKKSAGQLNGDFNFKLKRAESFVTIRVSLKNTKNINFSEKTSYLCSIKKSPSGNFENALTNFFVDEDLPIFSCGCENPEISKSYQITSFPYYLIISVKRTKYENGQVVKINWKVEMPEIILFEGSRYKMISLVTHLEYLAYNHYISTVKKKNKYFLCNDSYVKEVEGFDCKDVYYVMYEKY